MHKERESNIELLRIVAMLIIIVHHFCVHGVMQCLQPDHLVITTTNISWQLILTQLIGWGGHMANGIFVMITGFYMYERQINYKKIALLFITMLFYSWAIGAVLYGAGFIPWDYQGLIMTVVPVWLGANWFVSCYIVFSLFIPFINKLIASIDEFDLKHLIILLFVFDIFLPTFKFKTFFNGAPIIYFGFMYCVGGYCKKYLIQKDRYNSPIIWRRCLFWSMASLGLSILGMDFVGIYLHKDILINGAWSFVYIFSTFITVSMFMYFNTIPKFYNKTINRLATTTLGVYLIHDNDLAREVIWNTWLPNQAYISTRSFPFMMIYKTIIIYIGCVAIDVLRKKYIEPIYKAWIEKLWLVLSK